MTGSYGGGQFGAASFGGVVSVTDAGGVTSAAVAPTLATSGRFVADAAQTTSAAVIPATPTIFTAATDAAARAPVAVSPAKTDDFASAVDGSPKPVPYGGDTFGSGPFGGARQKRTQIAATSQIGDGFGDATATAAVVATAAQAQPGDGIGRTTLTALATAAALAAQTGDGVGRAVDTASPTDTAVAPQVAPADVFIIKFIAALGETSGELPAAGDRDRGDS